MNSMIVYYMWEDRKAATSVICERLAKNNYVKPKDLFN